MDDEILYMEPVPSHLLDYNKNDEQLPHFLVKMSEKDFQREHEMLFDTKGYFSIHKSSYR